MEERIYRKRRHVCGKEFKKLKGERRLEGRTSVLMIRVMEKSKNLEGKMEDL